MGESGTGNHILLVDDDPALARGLQIAFELEKYEVTAVRSLQSAMAVEAKERFDLVVLDVGLPDGSGFDFLKTLRASGSRLPVIVLTAKGDENSVIEGLQCGANDYVRKPFSTRELLARMRAAIRTPGGRDDQIRYRDLLALVEKRTLLYAGKPVELLRREFDILCILMNRAETVVTRDELLQAIDKDTQISDRTVDSHISHLRSRLKKSGVKGVKVSSVYGMGYRLEED